MKQTNSKNIKEKHHWLYEAIAAIKSTEEAEMFLKDLCTPAELEALADRWFVVPTLKHGEKSYRDIYQETGVSVTTIGRVARFITMGNEGYNLIYERVKKRKANEQNKVKDRNPEKR